jgi:membrane-bound lytic murein transglycosylase F
MGAVGLMQLLPATAQELGIENPANPEASVAGGAKYLRRLINEFDLKLPLSTRVRFALASYNVGRAHVLDARRLASRMGWRSDRWFGHVERAMLLLEEPGYAAAARYGYCRGSECVRYVQNVEQRYRTFLERLPGPTEKEEGGGHGVPRGPASRPR